jgi:hypothetical protein
VLCVGHVAVTDHIPLCEAEVYCYLAARLYAGDFATHRFRDELRVLNIDTRAGLELTEEF